MLEWLRSRCWIWRNASNWHERVLNRSFYVLCLVPELLHQHVPSCDSSNIQLSFCSAGWRFYVFFSLSFCVTDTQLYVCRSTCRTHKHTHLSDRRNQLRLWVFPSKKSFLCLLVSAMVEVTVINYLFRLSEEEPLVPGDTNIHTILQIIGDEQK